MNEIEVLSDSEWDSLDVPDIYFSRQYHELSRIAEPDGFRSIILRWQDSGGAVYFPIILRRIPGSTYVDATSAYGYGGPWIEGGPNLDEFGVEFDGWAKSRDVVATFVRYHPLMGNGPLFKRALKSELIGHTAAWDLSADASVEDQMYKSHRKGWRRAIRKGVTSAVTPNPVGQAQKFRTVYEWSMARLSAGSFYWFPDEYWSFLDSGLVTRSVLVEANFESRVLAAVWGLVGREYVHFHLSGTTDEGREMGASLVCRVALAQWAKDRGFRLAHHGGGAGGEHSSLLTWKRRFDVGSPLQDFYVSRITHDETAFEELSGRTSTTFFPPWRDRG